MSLTRRSTSIVLLALAVLFVLACCAPLPAYAQADGDADGAAALVAHQKEKEAKAQEKAQAEAETASGAGTDDAAAASAGSSDAENEPEAVRVPKFHRFRNRLAKADAPAEPADAVAGETPGEAEADANGDAPTDAATKLEQREARERSREAIEDVRERQETKREDREDKLEAELQKEEAAVAAAAAADNAAAPASDGDSAAPRKPARKQPGARAGTVQRGRGGKSDEELKGEAAERELEEGEGEGDERPHSPISDEQLKACPRGCSGHGECFLPKGSDQHMCACSEGWEGSACDEAVGGGNGQDASPSFLGTLLLLVILIIGVERSVWLYRRKCVATESAHDTAGFSRVATTIDSHDDQLDAETFRDERANDRL